MRQRRAIRWHPARASGTLAEIPAPECRTNPTRRGFLAASLLSGTRALGRTPDRVKLPARAVTRGPNHHWFGYYDKCPWDSSGRYLLCQANDYAGRQPNAGDAVTVGMVDLHNGDRFVPLAKTAAWSWQQGTMLQWLGGAPDREVVFNTAEGGRAEARVLNVHTGQSRPLPMPVYALSPDGTRAVTVDFARLHRLRPGYGYASLSEQFASDPAPAERGVWSFTLADPKPELVVSFRRLAANRPDARFKDAEHWVDHAQFSPTGNRVVLLHRWRVGTKFWDTRLYTVKPDGTDLRLHLDTGMVSHFDWRDDKTLLAWVKTPKSGNHFVTIDIDSNELTVLGDGVLTEDGHCSYSPDRRWILNDTYPDRAGRLQWLMLYDIKANRRYDLNQFASPRGHTGPVRCDLHPRFNRAGTQVCFDGCHGDARQVYVVDVADIVAG